MSRRGPGPALVRLVAAASRTQPGVTDHAIRATTSVVMLVCGLYTTLATVLRSESGDRLASLSLAVVVVVASLLLWLVRHRVSGWRHLVVHVAAVLTVGAGVLADGGGAASAADAALFTVMVVVANLFFPWMTAVGLSLFSILVMSAVLAAAPGVGPGDVVMMTCTAATTGVVVGRLSRVVASATAAAEVDVLTGVPNRRGAEKRLEAALAAHRGDAPLSLAVLDLDHFKQVNDSFGHAAGDELLRRAASSWAALLPPAAVLGRWGGDEFVLLARLDPASTADLTERMRSALPLGRSCTAGVTGLAVGDDLDAALSRADQGLYAAKRAGRGLTEVWTPALAGGQPWLESHPSMRSDSGSSGSSTPDSSGASSPSIPTAAS